MRIVIMHIIYIVIMGVGEMGGEEVRGRYTSSRSFRNTRRISIQISPD